MPYEGLSLFSKWVLVVISYVMFYIMILTGFVTLFYPCCLIVSAWLNWALNEEGNASSERRLKYPSPQEQVERSEEDEAERLLDIVIRHALPTPPPAPVDFHSTLNITLWDG